ncbi:EcsC protein family protein [compost metagenome]
MMRGVLTGAEFVNPRPKGEGTLQQLEEKVMERINFYSKTAAAEGAITGAGGILLGLADFPIWLSIKIKMLFEITALYGYDVSNFKERIYILHIFQLTFSSQQHRREVYKIIEDWPNYSKYLPEDIHQFDWRNFQQEYRDYIDLSKLLQLVPGIGAITGAYVNHRLTNKLGVTAMNAYRMRINKSLAIDGKMLN